MLSTMVQLYLNTPAQHEGVNLTRRPTVHGTVKNSGIMPVIIMPVALGHLKVPRGR